MDQEERKTKFEETQKYCGPSESPYTTKGEEGKKTTFKCLLDEPTNPLTLTSPGHTDINN